MRKREKRFIFISILPALICFAFLFVYPILRTVLMSFFKVPSLNSGFGEFTFAGIDNFTDLFRNYIFRKSMTNLLKIWLIGGAVTLTFSVLFAVILTSGVKWKAFWRSLIYLPNIISAVALASMWTQYVFNVKFGLLKTVFSAIGLDSLANVQWTSPEHLFGSMMFSYCFGCIGYFMLIFLAGIERIPSDLYECAFLEGAGRWKSFWKITFPLIRDIFKTCIMLWTISAVNFFVWSMMFSTTMNESTIVPVVFMYNNVFGSDGVGSAGEFNIGGGASVGVILTVLVLVVYAIMNKILKERELEY